VKNREIGHIRLMRPIRLVGLAGLVWLAGLVGLSSCSSEQQEPEKQKVTVEANPCSTAFEEAAIAGTRAWLPPTGFTTIAGMEGKSIGICFTRDGEEPKKGYFVYSSNKWLTSVEEIETKSYYLYGYIPHQGGVSCDISSSSTPGDNSSYSTGAVLTIKNLPTITSNDVCVLVGATNGFGKGYSTDPAVDYSITGLKPGDFEYEAKATSVDPPSTGNCVFLLFDHLYSSMCVRFKVHPDYNALRTIKLKKLSLKTRTEDEYTKKYTDITITLNKTLDGSSPIAKDGLGKELITYTQSGEIENDGTLFESTNGQTLTTSYSTFQGNFMPHGITKLIITSTYDVYDKDTSQKPEGNLIRKDCVAENTLMFSKLNFEDAGGNLFLQSEARRGMRYTINITIKPTYLYVMSDPDLVNPDFVVDE